MSNSPISGFAVADLGHATLDIAIKIGKIIFIFKVRKLTIIRQTCLIKWVWEV